MLEMITVLIQPSETIDNLTIRISPEAGDDLRELLREAGIPFGEVIELSSTVDTVTVIVAMIGTGGLGAWLGPLVTGLAQRHKDKKFRYKVGDQEIELNGYSVEEVKELLAVAEEERIAAAKQWTEIEEKVRREEL